MNIERSKTGIDYKSIADAYGYKPIPEGFEPITPVDVSIDWQTGAEQRQIQEQAVINSDPKYRVESGGYRTNVLIPTDVSDYHLTISRTENLGNEKFNLFLVLTNDNDEDIARYIVSRYGGIWNVTHRITHEAHQGKGVASHMIDEIDNCIQAYASATGQTQEIVLNTSQLSVLNIFLKHGYEVVDEDNQRFADVKSKLESGDSQYVLASCQADFREGNEERKTWYVFEREIYERLGEKIWDYDETDGKANYLEHSVRFKLRKKIESKSDDVASEVVRVRERVRSSGE